MTSSTLERPAAAAAARTTGTTPALSLTLPRSVLREALGKLLSVIPTSKLSMPIAACVLIDVPAGGAGVRAATVTLTGTDFDALITLAVPAEVIGSGRVALPARRLSDFVSSLPAAARVTINVDGFRATVQAGRSSFDLLGLPASEFPTAPTIEATTTLVVRAAPLIAAMSRAVKLASTAESRPVLNAVCLHVERDTLLAVGHDGPTLGSLAAGPLGGTPGVESAAQYRIPRAAVPSLTRMFGELDPDATLTITADEQRARFVAETGTMELRLSAGPYPAYRAAVERQPVAHTITCDRAALMSTIARVALAADDMRRIMLTIAPSADLTATSELLVQSATEDAGRAQDVVAIEAHERVEPTDTEPFSIAVNATFALAALSTITDERVRIAVGLPNTALVLRGASQEPADPTVVLLMPLRWSLP